jgi:hypothetical protein
MNNNSIIKYWNDNEETQLIDEINKLMDIDEILNNHNRKITGILIRIEKILNDPIKSTKIFNKNDIVEKYLTNTKNKYFIHYEELYLNILNFNSLDEISNNYNKLSHTKIKTILNDFLKKKDIDIAKKLRIKCLLKSKDEYDFAEKVFTPENKSNNISNLKRNNNQNLKPNNNQNLEPNNNQNLEPNLEPNLDPNLNPNLEPNLDPNNNIIVNLNSVIISLLEEIKIMRIDIFDIKKRVKIIMDKLNDTDKNKEYLITNKKKSLKINNLDIMDFENIDEENIDGENSFSENNITYNNLDSDNTKKKEKKNKYIDKIIFTNDDNLEYN